MVWFAVILPYICGYIALFLILNLKLCPLIPVVFILLSSCPENFIYHWKSSTEKSSSWLIRVLSCSRE